MQKDLEDIIASMLECAEEQAAFHDHVASILLKRYAKELKQFSDNNLGGSFGQPN